MKTTPLALFLTLSLLGACRKEAPPAAPPTPPAAEAPKTEAPPVEAAPGKSGQIEVTVTEEGFVPARIPAKVGVPITLAITRKAERTCATEILFAGEPKEKKTDLPLNQKVLVTYTPKATGDLKFGCAMGMMIAGVLAVEP